MPSTISIGRKVGGGRVEAEQGKLSVLSQYRERRQTVAGLNRQPAPPSFLPAVLLRKLESESAWVSQTRNMIKERWM